MERNPRQQRQAKQLLLHAASSRSSRSRSYSGRSSTCSASCASLLPTPGSTSCVTVLLLALLLPALR